MLRIYILQNGILTLLLLNKVVCIYKLLVNPVFKSGRSNLGSILPTRLQIAFTRADPKSKNSVKLSESFCAFAICVHKNFAENVGEVDPWGQFYKCSKNIFYESS